MNTPFRQELFACIVGIIIGGGVTWFIISNTTHDFHSVSHPIADPYDSEYHVHADFHIVVEDAYVNLSEDRFMTTAEQEFHPDAHLHDGNGEVKHIHAEGITFVSFLEGLGVSVTDRCISVPDGDERCATDTNSLTLFVNGEVIPSLSTYIPVDDDRILLYYGSLENPNLPTYLESIPDDACYYSGTCPERGVAPPESCGLTCEL